MRSPDNIWIATKNSDFSYTEVHKNKIDVGDIYASLPRLRRFLGYTEVPWSVAQHTLLCVKICEVLGYSKEVTKYVLLHDFHEAYTGDIPGPLHWLLREKGITIIKDLQKEIDVLIRRHFGLKDPSKEELDQVKEVDMIALNVEAALLFPELPDWVDEKWLPMRRQRWEIEGMLNTLKDMSEDEVRKFLMRVSYGIITGKEVPQ